MRGRMCSVGSGDSLTRLFYFTASPSLLIEVAIGRRDARTQHLVQLVDAEGLPIPLPAGARFQHVRSAQEMDLLETYVERSARNPS